MTLPDTSGSWDAQVVAYSVLHRGRDIRTLLVQFLFVTMTSDHVAGSSHCKI